MPVHSKCMQFLYNLSCKITKARSLIQVINIFGGTLYLQFSSLLKWANRCRLKCYWKVHHTYLLSIQQCQLTVVAWCASFRVPWGTYTMCSVKSPMYDEGMIPLWPEDFLIMTGNLIFLDLICTIEVNLLKKGNFMTFVLGPFLPLCMSVCVYFNFCPPWH